MLGGQILELTSWRGIFVLLAVIAAVVLLAVVLRLPETLPPERRDTRGVRGTFRTLRSLLGRRDFMGYAVASSLSFATVFAYVSGSSFVLQDIYGLSPQLYSVVFGFNGIGLIISSRINSRIAGRIDSELILRRAMLATATASLVLLAIIVRAAWEHGR